jgi:hypothetical protein
METTDPMAALRSKEIADRAAGCRDLSLTGTVEHLELLAELAASDRSPGVRLNAAAAAADILSRCRTGDARSALSEDQRGAFVSVFARINPAVNAGIFPIMACLDHAKSRQMIFGGLRDPQADVRLGAAVGLMRLCSSISAIDDPTLEDAVTGLLADTRHQPDAIAQIARVCAAVGYTSATELIRYLQLSGTHAEMVMEALGVLDGAHHPLQGVWYSDGNDAGETNVSPSRGPMLAVFDGSTALIHDGKRWIAQAKFEPRRRMFIRRVGEAEAGPAFQTSERTFYVGTGGVVDRLVSVDWSSPGKSTKAAVRGIEALSQVLPDTALDHLGLARLAMAAGMPDVAKAALLSSIEAKKTPPASWLALADMLWDADKKGAKTHYATYVKKGKRKDDEAGMERAKSRA